MLYYNKHLSSLIINACTSVLTIVHNCSMVHNKAKNSSDNLILQTITTDHMLSNGVKGYQIIKWSWGHYVILII